VSAADRPPIPLPGPGFIPFVAETLVRAAGGWGGGGGIAARIKDFVDTSPAFEGKRPGDTQTSTTARPPPRAGTPIPPKAPFPPPGYNPVLTPPVPYEPPPPPPPSPRPGTPDIGGGAAPSSSGIPWGVFGTFDIVQILKDAAEWRLRYGVIGGLPMPKQPPKPPVDTGGQRGDPFPAKGPQVVVVNMPAQPPKPRQSTGDWLSGQGLGRISITAKRVPVPKAPAPRTAPPPPKPLWQTLLGLGLPLLSAFGKQGSQQQRQVVNLPDPFGPGTEPDPRLEPQPSVFFGDVGGREGGGVGSFTCECLPPKKKRRKKKRTVCYTGTYTERADGTRKVKKRKVPCK
jgi:hypothetical protein